MARNYKLEPGLQQLLAAGMPGVSKRFETMVAEVDSGTISAETRSFLVAIGWITPFDGRVKLVGDDGSTQPTRRATSRRRPAAAEPVAGEAPLVE